MGKQARPVPGIGIIVKRKQHQKCIEVDTAVIEGEGLKAFFRKLEKKGKIFNLLDTGPNSFNWYKK